MNCKKAISELSGYLEGDIDVTLKQTLEAHLLYCNHCHAVYDSAKKTIELYCDGKLFSLPNEVRNRLHEAVKRRFKGKICGEPEQQ